MSSGFDPYYEWLGIPPAESANGGPNHYRLLGLQLFESNPRVIENAADRLMSQLRGFAAGPNGPLSQKLLNQVAAARSCLLDDKRRAAYDKPLRAKIAAAAPKPQVMVQPVYVQVPVPVQTPLPPRPVPPSHPIPVQAFGEADGPSAAPVPFTISSSAPSRRRSKSDDGAAPALLGIVKIALGGLGGLSIAVLVVWVLFRSDPFGLFGSPAPTKTVATSRGPNSTAPKKVNVAPKATTPVDPVNHAGEPKPTATTAQPGTKSPAESANTVDNAPQNSAKTKPANTTPETHSSEPSSAPVATVPATVEPTIGLPETNIAPVQTAKRQPLPPKKAQEAKLAEMKTIYGKEFESGLKASSRQQYIDFLLETAEGLKSDPIACYVLRQEAFLALLTAKDFAAAAEVVDRLEAEFQTDPFTPRLLVLTKASTEAKLPADRLAIVLCASELVDHAIARQRISEADKLIRIAEGQAKTLSDPKLRAKMTALKLQVEKLADEWGPVERARQALATDPNNADAALVDGRYRCLVEGDWKAGIELLARGSDQQLAAAARQDLSGPGQEVTAAIIADTWYEIAKSDEKLAGFYARARHWYKQVTDAAEGLDRVRIQQRIEQIEALNLPQRLMDAPVEETVNAPLPPFYASFARTPSFEPVDLFTFVHRQDLAASPWGATSDVPPVLYSDDATAFGRLPVRYAPPREYQVTIRVRRASSNTFEPRERESGASGPFIVGLVGPKSQFIACVDLPVMAGEFATFLSIGDAKSPADNPTFRRLSFAQVRAGLETTIVCQVRRRSVSVAINSNEVCRYEGELARLTLPKEWSISDSKSLFIGSHQCGYEVTGWTLEPLPVEAPLLPGSGGFSLGATDGR